MKPIPAIALRAAIRAYQVCLSPFLGGACRFAPSCSAYAHEAVGRHGARRGLALALRRVARCHPFHPGGFDPVPERIEPARRHGATRVGAGGRHDFLARRPS
jgi:putative membrane protein insertion efficiency factor